MKKKTILILSILMLALVACSGGTVETGDNVESTTNTEDISSVHTLPDDVLSVNQLLFGTILLEETADAVTADQSTTLLPLWQVTQTLSASNTTAQEEFQAVLKQIQGVMTAEQLTYMVGLEFTMPEMILQLQEKGYDVELVTGGGPGDGTDRPDGAVPGSGGGMGRGGGLTDGSTPDPEMLATAEARRAERGGGSTSAFYDILIEMLEGKLGS